MFIQMIDLLQTLNYNVTVILNKQDTPITKKNFMFNLIIIIVIVNNKTICGDVLIILQVLKEGEETLLKYFPDLKFRHVTVNEIYKESKNK